MGEFPAVEEFVKLTEVPTQTFVVVVEKSAFGACVSPIKLTIVMKQKTTQYFIYLLFLKKEK